MAKTPKALNVNSDQLRYELQEIKERLTTLESIDSFVHRDKLSAIAVEAIGSDPRKKHLLKLCSEPQTREELWISLGLSSNKALDAILRPLKEQHVLLEKTEKGDEVAYVQSRLLRKLPKTQLEKLLN